MNYVYSFYDQIKYLYSSVNPANLSGAIDVVVVEQPDGTLLSTPFHVRFGKYNVFTHENKLVYIEINKREIDLHMKLSENGVAFFEEGTASSSTENLFKERTKSDVSDKLSDESQTPRVDKVKDEMHKLPYFSSSIHSLRRNRSLPELSLFESTSTGFDFAAGKTVEKKTHMRKATLGSIQVNKIDQSVAEPRKKPTFKHSASIPHFPENGKVDYPPSVPSVSETPKASSTDELNSSRENSKDNSHQSINDSFPAPPENRNKMQPVDNIADGALSDSEVERHRRGSDATTTEWKWGEIPEPKNKKKEENKEQKRGAWSWFRWRTTNNTTNNSADKQQAEKKAEEGLTLDDLAKDPAKMNYYVGPRPIGPASISSNMDSGRVSLGTSPCSPSLLSLDDDSLTVHDDSTPTKYPTTSSPQTERAETPKKIRYSSGNSQLSTSTYGSGLISDDDEPLSKKPKRSLRLSSDQLKQLGLEYGSNEARFSITTKIQGTAWCTCSIYMYKWNEKLVISDIDGTITKSDVLGHVIPAIGGTWAQMGVAELYSRIEQNGYKMVYLSSRAIGQMSYTKTYLKSIVQGSTTLPDGPLLLSPTSVLMALRKEVIERRPDEFKIACLSDLKSLFPNQPFFAGFGNRETDVKSYLAVDIPPQRILIINHLGLVKRADKSGIISDYTTMAMDTVDYIFPCLQGGKEHEEEARAYNIWRNMDYSISNEELQRYEESSKGKEEAAKPAEKTSWYGRRVSRPRSKTSK